MSPWNFPEFSTSIKIWAILATAGCIEIRRGETNYDIRHAIDRFSEMLVFHRLYSFIFLVIFSIERLGEENKSLKLKVSADTDHQEKVIYSVC